MDLQAIVNGLNNIIWSNWLIGLCLIVGIYFSFLTRFLQVRHIKAMVKQLFTGSSSETGVSSFQGFAMALGGRVGTGNIAGVATAIAMGGPGALFWMWAIAFLGAGSAYIESALAQVWKVEQNGTYVGGPAYYIEKGMGQKWYAVIFAIAAVLATGVFLPGVQANSIATSINTAFGVPTWITGLVVAGLLGFIIFGGVKRIGRAAELIVPFMAIGYILLSLIIIIVNIGQLPAAIALIFKSAFGADAVFGAVVGSAVQWGVKRGIYSNEAGQGTGPIAAAAAEVSHPAKQGLVQAFSVYVDTLFVCSATGFMLIITGAYNVLNPAGGFLREGLPGVAFGPAFTQEAVNTLIPGFGSGFVAIALFFFAFTTLMAYSYYAESNLTYLFKSNKTLGYVVKALILIMVFYGTVRTAELAWGLGDVGVGLMAWLNIIAIVILTKPGLATLKDYEEQVKLGLDPVFIPSKLGLKGAEIWETIIPKHYSKQLAEYKEKMKQKDKKIS